MQAVDFCNTCAPNVDSVFTENLSHIARTPFGMELALNSPDRSSTAVLRQTHQGDSHAMDYARLYRSAFRL
ncbi:hypothetical protein PCAR4_20072 [Paraburkholderia caribensis]|nr:hypothetical protein PCAR4_20072 [Paraburkholderia caribensis]